ncbi:MAG: prepilin-type N-terminal cleavage/methylation domain-containing protein, partial [Deltaproteobacteria bacterium]|nr:prepilin-type N-terminal cleavage/methylation domain-containing protein [Deltaproteobacteria bacterium]
MARIGFTLLEVIITLVLFAILGAMILPYYYSGAMDKNAPLTSLTTPLSVQAIMASIIADYNSSTSYQTDPATNFASQIVIPNYGLTANYIITKNAAFK